MTDDKTREALGRVLYDHRESIADAIDGWTDWFDLPESWRGEWLDAAGAILARFHITERRAEPPEGEQIIAGACHVCLGSGIVEDFDGERTCPVPHREPRDEDFVAEIEAAARAMYEMWFQRPWSSSDVTTATKYRLHARAALTTARAASGKYN